MEVYKTIRKKERIDLLVLCHPFERALLKNGIRRAGINVDVFLCARPDCYIRHTKSSTYGDSINQLFFNVSSAA